MEYKGCQEGNLQGIYTAREFYGMNASLRNSDDEMYLSTLYWNPFLNINGNATFEFFTSDLLGRYKIIVEGIAGNSDVFY